MARCRTCNHPQRDLIEAELVSRRGTIEIGAKWGIPDRSLRRHRLSHMTQEQVARIRHDLQPGDDIDIEELVRRGGKTAMLAFARLAEDLRRASVRCESIGAERELATNRGLELKVAVEQAKLANQYPTSRRQVTNNTLVLSDGAAMFDTVGRILHQVNSIEDARRLFAAELRRSATPALEHES